MPIFNTYPAAAALDGTETSLVWQAGAVMQASVSALAGVATSVTSVAVDYTVALGDQFAILEFNSNLARTLTAPANGVAAIPVGVGIPVRNVGAGVVTVVAGAGATLLNQGAIGQNESGILWKRATNEWFFQPDPAPAGNYAASQLIAQMEEASTDLNVLLLSDSTAATATAWPVSFLASLAAKHPEWTIHHRRVAGVAPYETYDTAIVVQAGTGARTLTLYNASVAGWSTNSIFGYQRWQNLVAGLSSVALIIVAHAHNENDIGTLTLTGNFDNVIQDSTQFVGRMASYVQQLRTVHPGAPCLIMCTNPETGATADDQRQRAILLGRVASLTASSFHDVTPAFTSIPGWEASLMTDALHPNAAGEAVFGADVARQFVLSTLHEPAGVGASLEHSGINFITNPGVIQTAPGTVDGWTAVNCTPLIVTTRETGTGSTQLTSIAASPNYISWTLTGDSLTRWLGRWVTFAARIYVPELNAVGVAQGGGAGSLRIDTGTFRVYSQRRSAWMPFNNFGWRMLSVRIPTTATSVIFRIQPEFSSVANARIVIDRMVLTPGILLRDPT